jgi:hypothetical protein
MSKARRPSATLPAGIDRMTVDQLGDYLKQHWPAIRSNC